jgi:hypothetical protein
MQNDEETIVVQDEEQVDTVEVVGEEASDPIETEEDALAKAQADAAKYRRLFEKTQKAKPVQTQTPATPSNVEEVVLLANGMDETLMEQLKKVAAINNTSLIKAQNDPIFVAVKEKFEKDQKQKNASLPASRGSGSVQAPKTFRSPGLSREEHRKMVLDSR